MSVMFRRKRPRERLIRPHWALVAVVLMVASASPVRGQTLPIEEHFDSEDWARGELGTTASGAIRTWDESGGWTGGAAKLVPPPVEGYGSTGGFDVGTQTQVNVRFLMWLGSSLASKAAHQKLVIMQRLEDGTTEPIRPMVISNGTIRNDVESRFFQACHNIVCANQTSDRDSQPIYFSSAEHANEWVSIEFEVDLVNQTEKVFVYTQDGSVGGLASQHDFDETAATNRPIWYVEGIGHYWGMPTMTYDDETYIKLDELRIDDQYIGPPVGFVGSTGPGDGDAGAGGMGGNSEGGCTMSTRRAPAPYGLVVVLALGALLGRRSESSLG